MQHWTRHSLDSQCLYSQSKVSTLTGEGGFSSEQLVLIAVRFIYTVCGVWIRGWKNATDCEIAWFLSGMLGSSCAQSSALILGPERGPSEEGRRCVCALLPPCVCCVHPKVYNGEVLNGCVYACPFSRVVIPDKLSHCLYSRECFCSRVEPLVSPGCREDSADDWGHGSAFHVSIGRGHQQLRAVS